MARTSRRSKADAVLRLIRSDHRTVNELLRAFKRTDGERHRQAIVLTLCKELNAHALLEEELFYPALRSVARDGEVGEAYVEHSVVKGLVQKLEGMQPDEPYYEASVKVLGDLVEHHVDEEEDELFDLARRSQEDLQALAILMQERRAQLRQAQGLPQEAGEVIGLDEAAREAMLLGPGSKVPGMAGTVVNKLSNVVKGAMPRGRH